MGQVRRARTIYAPLEQVWNTLNDIAHTPEWVVGLERAELTTPGPIKRGSVYIDYNRLGPFLQRTPWLVTEFEPLVCQVHVSESRVIPTTMTLGLSLVPDGTRLEFIVDYAFMPKLGPVGRLLEGVLMNRMIGQVIEQNLANLDRRLSRDAAPVATGSYAAAKA